MSDIHKQCYICDKCLQTVSVELNNFIQDNIHKMSVHSIVEEVCAELRKRGLSSHPGTSHHHIHEHIHSHMLHPNVRMAVSVRNLVQLSEKLQNEIYREKHDDKGADLKLLEAYMRVQGQIASIYKQEPQKMLFYQSTQKDFNDPKSQ